MNTSTASSRRPSITLLGSLALAYFATGTFGLGIFIAEGTATLVWPPTGIAIASLLLFGWRLWPGVFVGAFLVNLNIGLPLAAALAIAAGNVAEALIAWWLVQRFCDRSNPFGKVRSNVYYLVLVVLLATHASALVGAVTTVLSGIRPADAFGKVWLLWWLGDAAGALLLVPVIYLATRRWLERANPDRNLLWGITGRYGEFALVAALAGIASLSIYSGWLPERVASHLNWLPFLFLLWAARRFSPLATVAISLIVTVCAITGILDAGTLMDRDTVNERLASLYVFLFVQAFSALVASALVHERKQMLRDLFRAREEAQRASLQKSRFLANMSHEIRTPLNGIIGMASLLQEEVQDREQRDRLRIIQSSADSLLNVLNDIIDHARLEAGKMTLEARDFSLQSLVRDVVGLFQPQAELKGLQLRARIDSNIPPSVRGDDTRLRQVLVNLVSNAVKFTDRGSIDLHVSTDLVAPGTITFTLADTGIGIPADAQERVLEAFTQADASTTRRHGGSGLGLTISKQLVERMGGTLAIHSDGANGTTVVVNLPLGQRD